MYIYSDSMVQLRGVASVAGEDLHLSMQKLHESAVHEAMRNIGSGVTEEAR